MNQYRIQPRIRALLIIILYSLPTFGQVKSDENLNKSDVPTIQTIISLDHPDFSIQYPSTWRFEQNELMGPSFIFFSESESPTDSFIENVNVLIQDLKGTDIDLDKFTALSEEQIKTMIPNSSILESKRMKNGKNEYHKFIYLGQQFDFEMEFEQYYYVKQDTAYVLTLTCEKSKYPDFKEVGEKILDSFAFKN